MLISVIIPNYNHAEYLRQRIHSVLSQNYPSYEVIILDDHSQDGSRDIIESYRADPRISEIHYNTRNSGRPFLQWAKGLALAKGTWIWIAESDDIADEHFLTCMTNLLSQPDEVSFAYCDAFIMKKEDRQELKKKFSENKNEKYQTQKWGQQYIVPGKEELDVLAKDCTINNVSSVLFNKEKLALVIANAEEYKYHGDWLIYLQLAAIGNIAYTPQALNIYRDHEKNHSKSADYIYHSKIECFHILDYLVSKYPERKKELLRYFTKNYTGFGLITGKPFTRKSIFRQYRNINISLAWQTLGLLIKLKLNIVGK